MEVVTNGEQAWTAAQLYLPDLLLTDLQMPGLDGLGLVRRLRADARTAKLPIILLTSCNDKPTRRRCLEAGATAFMVKPFRPLELLTCLRAQLPAGFDL